MSHVTKVAIVLPAFNEAKVITQVIKDLQETFRKSTYKYQIIVVDDGSSDNTAEKARINDVHVIKHILNSGSGGATATGLSYAYQNGFDMAATLDADGQHAAKDVLKGINLLAKGDVDLLIGSRLLKKEGMPGVKLFGNKGLSFITYLLFGINVTDSQSGLRVFSKRALFELKWRTNGYEFCSEMLWRAKQLHLRIAEYPIKSIYTDYSTAKGQNNWNGFNIVKVLLKRRVVELFGE